jgi:Xaa-Pro dipeptidase
MSDPAKIEALRAILDQRGLDVLVVGEAFNVRYVSGAWVAASHAQRDRPMFAVLHRSGLRELVVPASWESEARECADVELVRTIPTDALPLAGACWTLMESLGEARSVGIDAEAMSVALASYLTEELEKSGRSVVSVGDALRQVRMIKTPAERERLADLALKTDHAINGYFHHLIANRASSALVMSEQLRIHSMERDIELSGYNSCARAKVGEGTKKFWPYAPNYDFASMEVRKYPKDLIVAEVSNTDGGYWSNAIRMAVNSKSMTPEIERAYSCINRLRDFMLDALIVGRTCAEVYESAISFAGREEIPVHRGVPLGFSVGVAPMEAPFICPGERTRLAEGMVLVIDLVVEQDHVLYRSRDTVELMAKGPRIVDWYKDWREPYLAIGYLADFAM